MTKRAITTIPLEVHSYHVNMARDRNKRVCSMLNLIALSLELEDKFQQEHWDDRPPSNERIPLIGEIRDVVIACEIELNISYQELGSDLGFGGGQEDV